MKKYFIAISIALILMNCTGGESENTDSEEIKMTEEEESKAADEISEEIESDIEEINKTTEENLQEVDSLLENF